LAVRTLAVAKDESAFAGNPRQRTHLAPTGEAVEKLVRGKISCKLGDEKCIPGSRKPLTGHPDALKIPRVY
jgi:hypothetical protein